MIFSCARALFLSGITIASRTVSPKSTIPALEGLLVEAGEGEIVITGYNLKTGVRTRIPADVEEGGRLVLNAKLLGDIVRKMPEGEVRLVSEGSLPVKLTCVMSYFEIMCSSAEDFPELPTVEALAAYSLPENTLRSLIAETIFAVSTNESRPVHTGSLFEIEGGTLTVVSVDGFRLALRRAALEGDYPDDSFVVPGAALNEVSKIASESEDLVTIRLGARHILFTIGDTEVISRRLEGEFLDYRKSIPAVGENKLYADRRALLDVFERVSLIISEKYKCAVRCRFGDGVLRLQSATALGKATDECAIEGDGKELEIGFNSRYMLEALRAVPADRVLLSIASNTAPCVILPEDDSGDFVYLILPVRLV